jgi:hypothetical protein
MPIERPGKELNTLALIQAQKNSEKTVTDTMDCKRWQTMQCAPYRGTGFIAGFIFLAILLMPSTGSATQGHAGLEGVHVHQFAHLFFIFSMGTFIYWLRKRELVRMRGWRYLQYSAFFFILWNIDAFTVHLLEEQIEAVTVSKVDGMHIMVSAPQGFDWLAYVYYLVKLDHLLCVPAMALLYVALKMILKESFRDALAKGKD